MRQRTRTYCDAQSAKIEFLDDRRREKRKQLVPTAMQRWKKNGGTVGVPGKMYELKVEI